MRSSRRAGPPAAELKATRRIARPSLWEPHLSSPHTSGRLGQPQRLRRSGHASNSAAVVDPSLAHAGSQDRVGDFGRLVVDEHVARPGNELKVRATSGIDDALVNARCAPSRHEGVGLSVEK